MQLLFQQAAPLSSALKVLSWRYSLNITAAIIRLAGAKGKTSSSAVTFFNEKKNVFLRCLSAFLGLTDASEAWQ